MSECIIARRRSKGALVADFPRGQPDRLVLVIMAVPPVAGRAGLRLCPPLTPQQAAELQGAFLRDTLRQAGELRDVECVVFSPSEALSGADDFKGLVPKEITVVAQRSAGLGAGIREAIERASAAGFGRIMVIVSDCPTLPSEALAEGIAQLEEHDMVLGPCADGGYYALGLHGPIPQLFEGISWSTDWVLAQTLIAARSLALRWKLLPIWYDVDTPEELERLIQELAENSNRAPATSACLERMGLLSAER